MTYTHIDNLADPKTIPEDGILSRTIHKDEHLNVMLFGFAAGEELTEHRVSVSASIHILYGESRLAVDGDELVGQAGTWIHMPAGTPHSVHATTPVVMLLTMLRNPI